MPLTSRQYQVLKHLAYSLTNRQIGYSMNIGVETVKEHVEIVLRKLGLPHRVAAGIWVVKRGLV